MGSIVRRLPKVTSGIYKAQTTCAQAGEKQEKGLKLDTTERVKKGCKR